MIFKEVEFEVRYTTIVKIAETPEDLEDDDCYENIDDAIFDIEVPENEMCEYLIDTFDVYDIRDVDQNS